MNRSVAWLCALSCFVAALFLAKNGLAQNEQVSFEKFAIGGKKSVLGRYYSLKSDCTSVWQEVKIAAPPEHGEAAVKEASIVASYASPDPRVRCNGRSTKAASLEYTPAKGYTGKDAMEVELINESGYHATYSYDITVK